MRRNSRLLYVWCAIAAFSCAPATQAPDVEFGASDALGRWQTEQNTAEVDAAMAAGGDAAPSGSVVPQAGGSASPMPARGSAVNAGDAADSGSTDAVPQLDAGAAGAPAVQEPTTGVTSLSFEVTTSAAGGRYQPKNIGAIWIEDQSGNVVKSLEVWAGTRRRYLTGYLGAMAGGKIDVTTSATLSRHRNHTLTWDLKDRNGVVVPPGSYRVRMELTDGNQAGRTNAAVFDTSQGPVTLSPADVPSFSGVKVQLE